MLGEFPTTDALRVSQWRRIGLDSFALHEGEELTRDLLQGLLSLEDVRETTKKVKKIDNAALIL